MKSYEKPLVLANEELAEGVYAASGANPESGSVSVSGVSLKTSGNQYNTVNTYDVTIENNGSEDLTEWSANVSVVSGTASSVQIYNSWQASASLNGSTITITPGGGGKVEAGQSIKVELVVTYSGDSITLE